jgi:hypothetical protein
LSEEMEGLMSQAVEVTRTTAVGKARRPWAVATLCVITLRVYRSVMQLRHSSALGQVR